MTFSIRFRSAGWGRIGAFATLAGATAVLVVGGVSAGAASAAASPLAPTAPAAAPSAPTTTGWVRLAHLSPDTTAVDVQLSALAGGTVVTSLEDIGYGAVTSYMALPAGTYVVAMVPAGGDFASPVVQSTITVVAGEPITVAAYGTNAALATTVFRDDLEAPAAGQSRVRVVQASTVVPSVSVSTSTGTAIAADAKTGTATTYATVPAGPWMLSLTSPTVTSAAAVTLAAGSVSTLFVLDDASGGLALKAVLDSSSVGDLPTGGIQTGAGGTAGQHTSSTAHLADTARQLDPALPPTSTTTVDGTRRAIDELTGWAFLAAGTVAVLLIRRRDARSRGARGEGTRGADRARGADSTRGDDHVRGADRTRGDDRPSVASPRPVRYDAAPRRRAERGILTRTR